MQLGTTKHPAVGSRVELPTFSDQWMRGARFGTVARVYERDGRDIWLVRCDHPQIRRLYRHFADEFRLISYPNGKKVEDL